MSYSLNWLIENEIIYACYSGVTTAEELRECLTKMTDLIESSPRPLVHMISDVGDIVEAVPLKDSIRIVREVGSPPRAGWSISVREKSTLVKMGAAMGASIFRMRYRAFDTLEQAIEHLKSVDGTLNWGKLDQSIVERTKV
jgi:hypothetical protein